LITILSFIFVLGVLVFVHELGHFLAAKRVGVRVLKFQLGFNPTIAKYKWGETEYSIGALPLGGYVKMAGENAEERAPGEGTPAGALPSWDPGDFTSKTKWQRFQVLVAGPVMNLLLAVVVLAVVLYRGAEIPAYEDQPPVVGSVAAGSPAEKAGIARGDRLVSVAGSRVDTWKDFLIAVGTRPNREIAIAFLHDGVETTRQVTPVTSPGSRFEIGEIGVFPDVHPRVPLVNKGAPGERAGIKPGDVILAADGEAIAFRWQLMEAIASHPERPLALSIERDEQRIELEATPERCTDKPGCPPSGVWLGIQIAEATRSVQPGPFEAVTMSVRQNVESAGLIFQTLWGLMTRDTSPRQLLGPVGIAQLSGEYASIGWIALLGLMANLSLNLGLVNLLPIPVLDGGHIFIMAIEGVARRDFSVRVKEKMLLAGFVVLMMLMVTVIYNDLTRIAWIERLMPWR
jgi:regulator of sigma E protease